MVYLLKRDARRGCFVKVQVGLVGGEVVWNGGSCGKMRVFLFDC